MKLIKILRLLLKLTRKKNAVTITQTRIPIIWHLIKMNRNQYQTPVAVASIALCVFNIFHISHECRTPKRISPKPEFPKIQKSQPKFRIFGNSRNLLKIQKNPKFLEFPKIQKSKNPNPSFGFLETRGICSKSKKTKIPRVSRIFGNSRNLLKIQKKPKILEFPKIQKSKNPNPSFGFLETLFGF